MRKFMRVWALLAIAVSSVAFLEPATLPASTRPTALRAPSTRPATTRTASRPSRQQIPPEVLAAWAKLESKRADALALARKVEKGPLLEEARRNREQLLADTKAFNELIVPLAESSAVKAGGVPPKTGITASIWLYKTSRQIQAYNLSRKSEMEASEFEVIELVNAYREALGAVPVEFDHRLRESALGHSKWMLETGEFSHDDQRPGLKQHGNRMDREGYKWRGAGENIAFGQGSAEEVFIAWFNSPGHHHTMVGDWVHLGVGRAGDYWTQNFGSGEPSLALKPNPNKAK